MTTHGSINSQNRAANYSANYRGSLFSLERAEPTHTGVARVYVQAERAAPIIVAVDRLFVTESDRRQDPAVRAFSSLSPAFCHARLIGFGIGGMRNLQKQARKTAGPGHTVHTVPRSPGFRVWLRVHTRASRRGGGLDATRIRSRFADEMYGISRAKVRPGHRHPLSLFPPTTGRQRDNSRTTAESKCAIGRRTR